MKTVGIAFLTENDAVSSVSAHPMRAIHSPDVSTVCRGFHLVGTDAACSADSTGSAVVFSISEECLLFNLGKASVLTAKLVAIKFATRAAQDRDIKKKYHFN